MCKRLKMADMARATTSFLNLSREADFASHCMSGGNSVANNQPQGAAFDRVVGFAEGNARLGGWSRKNKVLAKGLLMTEDDTVSICQTTIH
jgi:hypothetical protein